VLAVLSDTHSVIYLASIALLTWPRPKLQCCTVHIRSPSLMSGIIIMTSKLIAMGDMVAVLMCTCVNSIEYSTGLINYKVMDL
jgi:hypothetical protein